jgi:glycosyltransferase involved in cell wall biosynthesis
VIVYADLRWPPKTGIGAVQSALLSRASPSVEIVNLDVAGRIGSPTSPLHITRALFRHAARRGVFWSPGFLPPWRSRVPVVVTVHDLAHMHHYTRFHAAYYGTVLKHLYCRCHSVICVSDYTRQKFLEWSGMSPDRVFTVYNGVPHDLFAQEGDLGLPYSYVFYPGNRRSYKNLDRLLTAYANSALPRAGIHIVLTGEVDKALHRKAREVGIEGLIHFTGAVSDQDLARLYRGATLAAFVSLYEGFGLPILEAMAAGIPVLTSNVTAMPEVAGGAALLVDPTCTEEISAGLERLSFDEDLRQEFVRLGRIQAARFDWDRSAAQVWKIVAAAAGEAIEV